MIAHGLTGVEGLRVGHWSDPDARTGCTVVLAPDGGCVASGLALGAAPGSREYALLQPEKTVQRVDAILLTGGSAFGLDAAGGVVAWLEERGLGVPAREGPVPIVPAAVLYDLWEGRSDVRPDARAGRAACDAASDGPVAEGRIGVGCGATNNQAFGPDGAFASGVGSAAMRVRGATVAALAVSNAAGMLVDPDSGAALAGELPEAAAYAERFAHLQSAHTTLAVIATDAPLAKAEARALAAAGHAGVARVTRPSHTAGDGDTCFALATGSGPPVPVASLGVAAQEVVSQALVRGFRAAQAG